jgi:hypothetical protein
MNLKTDDFIERLARGVEPVAPLQRPWRRAAMWLVGAAVYIGLLAMMMTSSADVSANSDAWRFLLPQVAAITVSGAAAAAAFASIVPGASSRVLLWPSVAVALWIGILLVGSVQEWQTTGAAGLAPQREWLCVAMIGVGGALPALAMARMLRDGAPLTPRVTSALVALAAAALANVGACISHPHPSSAVVLLWHGTAVASLVAVSAWAGRHVFSWERLRRLSR